MNLADIDQFILANLIVNLDGATLSSLIGIYTHVCGKVYPKIRASFIPLERRKHLIKNAIITELNRCENKGLICVTLMDIYFAKHRKPFISQK